MGGQDDGLAVVFWGAETGDLPDAVFEDFLPIFSLVDFSSYPNGFYNEAIFFGEGGV